MFSYKPEKVFLWNSTKKKENNSYKGEWVEYDEWLENREEYREEGSAVLQSQVGIEYDEDGKLIRKGQPKYLSILDIYNSINNGDFVEVEGDISYSTYEKDGREVLRQNLNLEKLSLKKQTEESEEISYFEQEMVFLGASANKKEGKVYVSGRHISYDKKWNDIQLVVDYNGEDGENDPDMVKLSSAFLKKIKFGDVINVFGDIWNKAIVVDDADTDNSEEDDLLASLGGRSKPRHAEKSQIKGYVSEMRINGVDAWSKKVYKLNDLQDDSLVDKGEEKENDVHNELGGKKKSNNPFADDDIDFSDEELPF